MSQTRRLAAILAADVAGYSRLMGADEEGTLERLKALRRELLDPKIAEHHGRTVNRWFVRYRQWRGETCNTCSMEVARSQTRYTRTGRAMFLTLLLAEVLEGVIELVADVIADHSAY